MVTAFANGRLSRSEADTWRLLPASAQEYRTFWPGPSALPGAVLYGRAAGPSLESPYQGCRLRISQQVGDLLQAQVGVGQVVLGQIAAYVGCAGNGVGGEHAGHDGGLDTTRVEAARGPVAGDGHVLDRAIERRA